MSHRPVLVGVPVGVPGYAPGPGYLRRGCSRCGRKTWIGPTQQRMADQGGNTLLCMPCAIALYPDSPVKTLKASSGAQIDVDAFNRDFDRWLESGG